MNNKHRLSAVILSCLFVSGILFPMVSRAGSLSAALNLTMNSPNGELSDRYSTKFGTGISFMYLYSDYVGAMASVHYHKFQRSGDGNDLSIIHGTIDGLLAYPFLGKWRVFIAGGMGLYAWQADHCWWTDGHNEEAGDIGFNYGIGVDYALTDDIEIESAIFQHRVEMKDNNRAFRWIEFAIGVRFNLFEHNN